MSHYRKKPVVIEAYQLTKELVEKHLWQNEPLPFGLYTASANHHPENKTITHWYTTIETLEGKMRAEIDYWVIKGIKGELYPCKPDIFEATYEPATPTQAD